VPLKIVYAGTPPFSVPALDALVTAGHRVLAVYTQPDRPAGRGRTLVASAVKQRALTIGLPVRQPASLRDPAEIAAFQALDADVAVVAAYGLLLPLPILSAPRFGCLNIHASLLPRWRGAAPVQRAMLEGDEQTGVSIMQMEEGLDTGPVLGQWPTPIEAQETAAELTERLAMLGARAMVETLARLDAGGSWLPTPQASDQATYARKLEKGEALIDWTRSAPEIGRRVRAFIPWPIAETRWREERVRIHAAAALPGPADGAPGEILAVEPTGIVVAAGEGRVVLKRLQLPGRNVVTAAEFANAAGRGQSLVGMRFGRDA
jgi:methionyl-tRNA formyltransferase